MDKFVQIVLVAILAIFVAACDGDTETVTVYVPTPAPTPVVTNPDVCFSNASWTGAQTVVPGQKNVEALAFRMGCNSDDLYGTRMTQLVFKTNSTIPGGELFSDFRILNGSGEELFTGNPWSSYSVAYGDGKAIVTFYNVWTLSNTESDDTFVVEVDANPNAPRNAAFRLELEGPQFFERDTTYAGQPAGGDITIAEPYAGFAVPVVNSHSRSYYTGMMAGVEYGGWEFEVVCPASNTSACVFKGLNADVWGASGDVEMVAQQPPYERVYGISQFPVWTSIAPGEAKKFYFEATSGSDYLGIEITDMSFEMNGVEVTPQVGGPCTNSTDASEVCSPVIFYGSEVNPTPGSSVTAWIEYAANDEALNLGKGGTTAPQVFTTAVNGWTSSSIVGLAGGLYSYRVVSQDNATGVTTRGPIWRIQVEHLCSTVVRRMIPTCKG